MTAHLSILIASHNRSKQLSHTLKSLLDQTFKDFEIIVLDDCYNIDSEVKKTVEHFSQHMDVMYVHSGATKKSSDSWRVPGYAFNIGARLASGRLLAISCAESYHFDNTSLEKFVRLFSDNKSHYACPVNVLDDNGEVINSLAKNKPIDSKLLSRMKRLERWLPFFAMVLKDDYINIGGYDEEMTGTCYDDADIAHRFSGFDDKPGLLNTGMDFIESTVIHLNHGNHGGLECPGWHHNKNLYEEKTVRKRILVRNHGTNWGESIMIPKIAHFYWGNTIMPYMRYLTLFSFSEHNPDWEIRLYTTSNKDNGPTWVTAEQKNHNLSNAENYWDKALAIKNLSTFNVDLEQLNISSELSEVHKSDILRWYLISKFGGIWSDMDILYLRSINPIVAGSTVVFTEYNYYKQQMPIGFLGAVPKTKLYSDLYSTAISNLDPSKYQSVGTLIFTDAVHKNYKNYLDMCFRNREIYPAEPNEIGRLYSSNVNEYSTFKNCTGIHWYAGHKLSGDFCKSINSFDDAILHKNINLSRKIVETLWRQE